MESWEIEQLRRSIVMASGSTVGPMTKADAERLIEEVTTARNQTERYREAVRRLRRVLDILEAGDNG